MGKECLGAMLGLVGKLGLEHWDRLKKHHMKPVRRCNRRHDLYDRPNYQEAPHFSPRPQLTVRGNGVAVIDLNILACWIKCQRRERARYVVPCWTESQEELDSMRTLTPIYPMCTSPQGGVQVDALGVRVLAPLQDLNIQGANLEVSGPGRRTPTDLVCTANRVCDHSLFRTAIISGSEAVILIRLSQTSPCYARRRFAPRPLVGFTFRRRPSATLG